MKRAALALAVLVASCGGRGDPPAPPPPPVPPKPPVPVPVVDARPPAPDARDPAVVRAEAAAVIARWLDAQNHGDLAAYQALYDARFSGVRRSGAQVAPFDRDGWMRDRARMFAHPMTVAADGVVAVEQGARVYVSFTQTFEQGSYHDQGKKLIVLARRGADLRIAHEEMIASTLLAPTAPPRPRIHGLAFGLGGAPDAASMQLAVVHEGELLLARTDDDLGDGPLVDPEHHSDMAGAHEHDVVSRRFGATLPAPLATAVGTELALLDERLAVRCTAKITSIDRLRAAGDDERDDVVWANEAHVIVAELDVPADCKNAVRLARPTALPALPPIPEPPWAGDVPAPDGTTFSIAKTFVDDCDKEEQRETRIDRRGGGAWRVDPINDVLEIVAALDVDGDGASDLVTTSGVFLAARRGAYDDWWPRTGWDLPAGVGCDGQE